MNGPRSRLEWSVNIADYRRDTPHLSMFLHGCYMMLLMYYWEHGGLPDDDKKVRSILGLQGSVWRKVCPVLKAFFHHGWQHKRLDRDLANAQTYSARQRRAARRRWKAVDSGEEQIDARGRRDWVKQKQNQRRVDATALPLECSNITDRFISISSNSDVVQKWPSNKQANSKQHRAQQAVERHLLRELGPDNYATAIERLAGEPELIERATQAEMRQPGSGALVAMIGLHRITGAP